MQDILSLLKEEFNEQRGAFTFSRKKVSEIIRALEDYNARIEHLKEKLQEREEVWRLRAEREAKEWQKLYDLKRYAELFGTDAILCDKIENL